MKLSALTLSVLKLYSTINPHLVVEPGNQIRTVNKNITYICTTTIPETFETGFALHDLPAFLKVLNLFKDPDITIDEKYIHITDGQSKQKVALVTDLEELVYENRNIELPESDNMIEVNVDSESFKKVIKAAGVNGVEDIVITVDEDGDFVIQAMDKEHPARVFCTKLGKADGQDFKAFFKHSKKGEKLNILDVDYKVSFVPDSVFSVWDYEEGDVKITVIIGLQQDGTEFN